MARATRLAPTTRKPRGSGSATPSQRASGPAQVAQDLPEPSDLLEAEDDALAEVRAPRQRLVRVDLAQNIVVDAAILMFGAGNPADHVGLRRRDQLGGSRFIGPVRTRIGDFDDV